MSDYLMEVRNGTKNFGATPILEQINLAIAPGEFISLLGPSGSGKTTLLRLLARLESWTTGDFLISTALKTGFVFQEPNLLSWRTVFENVQLPFELNKHSRQPIHSEKAPLGPQEKRDKVMEALRRVKLLNASAKMPHELSGGMRMRVSIARALVTEPNLLFLDEPFAALDEPTREELQEQLWEIKSTQNTTIIFVTHSLTEATFLSEKIYFLAEATPSTIKNSYTLSLPAVRDRNLRSNDLFFNELREIRKIFQSLSTKAPHGRDLK